MSKMSYPEPAGAERYRPSATVHSEVPLPFVKCPELVPRFIALKVKSEYLVVRIQAL